MLQTKKSDTCRFTLCWHVMGSDRRYETFFCIDKKKGFSVLWANELFPVLAAGHDPKGVKILSRAFKVSVNGPKYMSQREPFFFAQTLFFVHTKKRSHVDIRQGAEVKGEGGGVAWISVPFWIFFPFSFGYIVLYRRDQEGYPGIFRRYGLWGNSSAPQRISNGNMDQSGMAMLEFFGCAYGVGVHALQNPNPNSTWCAI